MNERFILGWPFVAFDWQGLWCPGRRDACRFRCLRRMKWHLRWWRQMTPLGSRWSGISGQYVPNFGNRKWRLEPIKLRAQLGCSTCWAGLFQGQMRFLKRRPHRDHRFPSQIWLWTHGLSHLLSHGGRISQHPVAPHRECYGDATAKNDSWCIVHSCSFILAVCWTWHSSRICSTLHFIKKNAVQCEPAVWHFATCWEVFQIKPEKIYRQDNCRLIRLSRNFGDCFPLLLVVFALKSCMLYCTVSFSLNLL